MGSCVCCWLLFPRPAAMRPAARCLRVPEEARTAVGPRLVVASMWVQYCTAWESVLECRELRLLLLLRCFLTVFPRCFSTASLPPPCRLVLLALGKKNWVWLILSQCNYLGVLEVENQLLVNRSDLKRALPDPSNVVSQKQFFQGAGLLESFFTESFKA